MNLNHLRHLIALAEHQSFRKAADALCLTQPALSRSIQALEHELDVKLIDRDGKRNTLTAYGQQVVSRARHIVFEARELQRGITLLKDGELGTIGIGFGPTPASILMTPFLIQMANHHPRIQVKLARGSVPLLTQSLHDETVDVIVVDLRALSAAEDLRIEALPALRGGFLCRSQHPLRALARIDLAALRQYPVASMPLSDEIAQDLVTQLGTAARPAQLMSINSEDVNSLLDVVEATDAVFFGIFASARARISAGQLREIKVQPHFERAGRYALVTLARRSDSPAMTLFRKFALAAFTTEEK